MSKQKVIIKNETQIAGIKEASRIAALTLDYIGQYVKVGITTEELDHICNAFIMQNGGKSACIGYHQYPKYTCISINDTICHGIPSKSEVLKDGDIVNIDVTVFKAGYFGDTSRMYTVGNVSKTALKLIEVTKKALEIGISQVFPGNYTSNIGYEISKYVEKLGYSVVREYTGHGIGLQFHEEPYIYHKAQKNNGTIMAPGMIFTIEPMINIGDHRTKLLKDGWTVKTSDGNLSAQFEHTILVTEDGYEILTLA
ncbi:type I methionyl aminopeptidase [Candidatus Gracilibacteria bacterium]|nr:type I methionyl aminopeptidase [Candidatus Gracilibacteria bacterium]